MFVGGVEELLPRLHELVDALGLEHREDIGEVDAHRRQLVEDGLRSLGLALFCYTVGLAAGNTFFRDLRRQLPLMALCVVALVIAGAAGGLYSHLTGVSPAMDSGAYAGALTSPVLDAAIEAGAAEIHVRIASSPVRWRTPAVTSPSPGSSPAASARLRAAVRIRPAGGPAGSRPIPRTQEVGA